MENTKELAQALAACSVDRKTTEPEHFNRVTDVSADAVYIAKEISKTIWLAVLVVPCVLGLAYSLITALMK
jgi:hypothetical protein